VAVGTALDWFGSAASASAWMMGFITISLGSAELDDHLQRLDKSDATESAKGGSRVKNLAEKIAAMPVKAELTKASSVPPRGSWRRPRPSTLPSRGICAGSPG
jgi:hypothetical protein